MTDTIPPNVIVYADDLAEQARAAGTPGVGYEARWAYMRSTLLADYPLSLSIPLAVNYSDKTDRYTLKFDTGTAKVTNAVAQHLLTHAFGRQRPTVFAHMTDGTIDAVLLLYVSHD